MAYTPNAELICLVSGSSELSNSSIWLGIEVAGGMIVIMMVIIDIAHRAH